MRICRIVSALLVGITVSVGAQVVPVPERLLPLTGIDFSGVDQFWRLVDLLSTDVEPSEMQWHALFATPWYRLAQSAIGVVVREAMELAFRPSRRTIFDSLSRLDNDRAYGLRHLARAVSLRPQLEAFRDSLARSSPVAEAVRSAARFLSPGATSVGEPPLVAFALFFR